MLKTALVQLLNSFGVIPSIHTEERMEDIYNENMFDVTKGVVSKMPTFHYYFNKGKVLKHPVNIFSIPSTVNFDSVVKNINNTELNLGSKLSQIMIYDAEFFRVTDHSLLEAMNTKYGSDIKTTVSNKVESWEANGNYYASPESIDSLFTNPDKLEQFCNNNEIYINIDLDGSVIKAGNLEDAENIFSDNISDYSKTKLNYIHCDDVSTESIALFVDIESVPMAYIADNDDVQKNIIEQVLNGDRKGTNSLRLISKINFTNIENMPEDDKTKLIKMIVNNIPNEQSLKYPDITDIDFFIILDKLLDHELVEHEVFFELLDKIYTKTFRKFVDEHDEQFPQLFGMVMLQDIENDK